MRRYGVFGGTFDPVHTGHLIAAERVKDALGLDSVLFVPAGTPPHKSAASVSEPEHRYLMTLLATLDNPGFRVHRVDLDRPGRSFTVDTLALLRKEYGPETELFFIMGADSLADLPTWHEPGRLLRENRIAVATRPGWQVERIKEALGTLYPAFAERVLTVEIPAIGVSSSEIRSRVAQGRSIRYLVPHAVERYIEKHGLYRERGPKPPPCSDGAPSPSGEALRGDERT